MPGPGQQPQAFESAGALVARPSWNLLAPKSTQPLQPSATSLVVGSTTATLSPNDVILLELGATADAGAGGPRPVRVASATVDFPAKVTHVTLQAPAMAPAPPPAETTAGPPPPAETTAGPPPPTETTAGPPPPTETTAGPPPPAETTAIPLPQTATTAIDTLLAGGLGKPAPPVPVSANRLPQTPGSVFGAGSDAVPRLISALQPAAASSLYSALGTTPIGSPPVTAASVMRIKAAPFGAAAPPQPVFNASGQPTGTRDRPIGDTFTLQLSVTADDFMQLLQLTPVPAVNAPNWLQRVTGHPADTPARPLATPPPVIDVQCSTATFTSQATMTVSGRPPAGTASLPSFGQVGLESGPGAALLSYTASPPSGTPSAPSPPPTPPLQASAKFDSAHDAVTLGEFIDPGTHASLGTVIWDSFVRTPFSAQVGATQVAIAWATSPGGELSLTASVTTPLPLPLAERTVLRLDGSYPGIIPGSYVVIDSADPASSTVQYPVIVTVGSVGTVAASAYG